MYGAAEFSRDSDFVVLASPDNVTRLSKALRILKAEPVFFPELKIEYLEKGHACHFRCHAQESKDLRVDIMARLRGCDSFEKLWKRRTRVRIKDVGIPDIISLRDLVQSKKTQRDKDWLMLTRLVENDILLNNFSGSVNRVTWWLGEARVPETLMRLCAGYPKTAGKCSAARPLLRAAIKGDAKKLILSLKKEELAERAKDVEYWNPLKKELESLRLRRKGY